MGWWAIRTTTTTVPNYEPLHSNKLLGTFDLSLCRDCIAQWTRGRSRLATRKQAWILGCVTVALLFLASLHGMFRWAMWVWERLPFPNRPHTVSAWMVLSLLIVVATPIIGVVMILRAPRGMGTRSPRRGGPDEPGKRCDQDQAPEEPGRMTPLGA